MCSEKLPVPPIRGGAIQLYIEGIVPFLIKRHQITVFSIGDPGLKDHETVNGVEYCRVHAGSKSEYVQLVSQQLAARHFDIVHIFNRPKSLRSYYNASPGSKFILSLHNEMFAPHKISRQQAIFCLETVQKVITVSDFIKKSVEKNYPPAAGKIKTIYSGVNPDEFYPVWTEKAEKIKQEIKGKYGVGNGKVVLVVTRFSEKKGVHLVLAAMEQVLKKHPQTILMVVGSKWYGNNRVDDYVSHVYRLAKNLPEKQVIFTGFIPPKQVTRFFSAGDIFVCASQWQEPLARIHYEAMAAGLPIVTTDRGGNAEVVEGYGNGIIIPQYDDSNDFAWAINYLLENPATALAMGKRGRKLAEERYNWGRLAGEILEIYDSLGDY
ncbi:glycosyltransferase family 4 protein [Desulfallas thermosapovorans]|uniref:Spore coat protein SA n=1 Tax=Desulfallas thermosapovorans DSM 6562 TaxID=1121431 RepID=A0A5S4ZUU3_9FIRM|nr:glycosyltransferase family 4 protein [Desulfallas thermosapovorans]TYO95985.1 spore coat protein SA [Desulfallas thermosapovorans DSM 6562]